MKKLCVFLVLLFTAFDLCAQQTNTQKPTAAVMDLEAKEGVSAGVAASLSDYLRVQLVNTQKFDIVTRENMEEVLKEQKFQLSGCTSRECVVQVGQLLGVRRMFAGVITKIGATYVVTLKIIDVESGKIGKAETEECAKCEEDALLVSMRNIANKITGLPVKEGVNIQPAQSVQAGKNEIIWEKDGSAMVLIPAGEFLMGSPEGEGEADEHPQHKVYLDAYYIDKYEVTNQQFAKFLNEWGKDTDENGQKMIYENEWGIKKVAADFSKTRQLLGWEPAKGYETYPVINVTWYGGNQYAKWAGKRLPTEAEWEKACRGPQESSGATFRRTTKYCYGNEENKLNEYAWYSANSGSKTHPVGAKEPNTWGVYDMHGNVWEWCSDWYDENYYKNAFYKNPQGPDKGGYRVIRGGSWDIGAVYCRSVNRGGNNPDNGWYNNGFRCAASRGE